MILHGGHAQLYNRNNTLISLKEVFTGYRAMFLNADGQLEKTNPCAIKIVGQACNTAPAIEGDAILTVTKKRGDGDKPNVALWNLTAWRDQTLEKNPPSRFMPGQTPPANPEKAYWHKQDLWPQALTLCPDAAVMAVYDTKEQKWKLNAYDRATGNERWSVPLPGEALLNGLAPSANGTWVVVMGDGSIAGVGTEK